jgi:hypothetical protein
MTVHELKIWVEYFEPVAKGVKTFELRKADRDYQVGDILKLREWDPNIKDYTGQRVDMKVTYILDGSLAPEGMYRIMSIIPFNGLKCQTCGDYCEDDDECCAQERSRCTILPVGGFDENDPQMIKSLECWRPI